MTLTPIPNDRSAKPIDPSCVDPKCAEIKMCFRPHHNPVCQEITTDAFFRRVEVSLDLFDRLCRRSYILGACHLAKALEDSHKVPAIFEGCSSTDLAAIQKFLKDPPKDFAPHLAKFFIVSREAEIQASLRPGILMTNASFSSLRSGDVVEDYDSSGIVSQRLIIRVSESGEVSQSDVRRSDWRPLSDAEWSILGKPFVYRRTLESIAQWGRALELAESSIHFSKPIAKTIILDPIEQLLMARGDLGPNSKAALAYLQELSKTATDVAEQGKFQTDLASLLVRLTAAYPDLETAEDPGVVSRPLVNEIRKSTSTDVVDIATLATLAAAKAPRAFERPEIAAETPDDVGVQLWRELKIGVVASMAHTISIAHQTLDSSALILDLKTDRINPRSVRELALLNLSINLAIRRELAALPSPLKERRDVAVFFKEIAVALDKLQRDLKHSIPENEGKPGVPGLSDSEILQLMQQPFEGLPKITTLSDLAAYRFLVSGSRIGDARQAQRQTKQFGFTGEFHGGAEFLCGYGGLEDAKALWEVVAQEIEGYKGQPGFSEYDAGTTAGDFMQPLIAHVDAISAKAPWLR